MGPYSAVTLHIFIIMPIIINSVKPRNVTNLNSCIMFGILEKYFKPEQV